MVENKSDFAGDAGGGNTYSNPPLVPATAVGDHYQLSQAHPDPSAPLEVQPPSYEQVMTSSNDNSTQSGVVHVIPPPVVVQDAQSDQTAAAAAPSSEDAAAAAPANITVASGTTAAVFGFLFLGGPIGAVILGFSAAYASQKEGAAGDIARTVGDIGVTVKEKAKQINDKHHLVD
ncbi:MAG: hypothetical protein SGARI_007109 [Bacillariaceae sp.]